VQQDCRTTTFGELCTVPVDYKVEKIITHPLHNTVTKHNDIALIRVTQDINFDNCKSWSLTDLLGIQTYSLDINVFYGIIRIDFIKPVCLPFLKEYGLTLPEGLENSNATVAGWGRDKWSNCFII